jgi:hypothetical protein
VADGRGAVSRTLVAARPTSVAPPTVSISTADTAPHVGGTLDIVTTGAITSMRRYLGGVDQGAVVDGYAFQAEDILPTFEVVVSGPGGSATSNTLRTSAFSDLLTPPEVLYDRSALTLVSTTHVSAQADGSGNGHTSMANATDAERPTYGSATSDIHGVPAIKYANSNLAGPTLASILSDDTKIWLLVPLRSTTVNIAAVVTSLYNAHCVVGSDGRHLLVTVHTTDKAGFWGTGASLVGQEATATLGAHLLRCRKEGTTIGIIVDGGTEVSGAVGNASISPTTELLRFGYSGFGGLFAGSLGDIAIWNTPPSAKVKDTAAALLANLYSLPESAWS